MEVIVQIKHWDDGSEARKELRLYTMSGKAIGFGEQKLLDNKAEPDNNPQGDLFTVETTTNSREVTYLAKIDLDKLIEGGQ